MKKNDELINISNTVIILVDVQEKLFPFIINKFKIADNIKKIIEFSKITDIPIILTEQNPNGLGRTTKELKDMITDIEPIEKYTFSCVGEKKFLEDIDALARKNIVVVGIESHICIMQTVIDLLGENYNVHVVADAIGSRSELTHTCGITRMREAGAVISNVEMFMYEMLKTSKHPKFKEFLNKIMK